MLINKCRRMMELENHHFTKMVIIVEVVYAKVINAS